MTEPDILSHKITELKEWQRVAWRRIADPVITPFERREVRNHIKESDGELRRCLGWWMFDRLRLPSSQGGRRRRAVLQTLNSGFLSLNVARSFKRLRASMPQSVRRDPSQRTQIVRHVVELSQHISRIAEIAGGRIAGAAKRDRACNGRFNWMDTTVTAAFLEP